jgi:hypothetical protein
VDVVNVCGRIDAVKRRQKSIAGVECGSIGRVVVFQETFFNRTIKTLKFWIGF